MTGEKTRIDVEVMERYQLCHDLLTELRKQIKHLETAYFGLIGQVFGELTVLHRQDRTKVTDEAEVYVPGWACRCDCGEELAVSHEALINGDIRNCGSANHNIQIVTL